MLDRRTYLKAYRQTYKRRVKRVTVTFSNDQYERLARIAARDGKGVATLIGECALATLDRTAVLPARLVNEFAELRYLVGTVANNINQLARHSNTVRAFIEEAALLDELERMQRAVESHTSRTYGAGDDH